MATKPAHNPRRTSYNEGDRSTTQSSFSTFESTVRLLKPSVQQPQTSKKHTNSTRCYSGAYNSLIIAATVITIPFLAFTGFFAYLITHYQVERGSDASPQLRLPSDNDDSHAYYIQYSGTKLTTVADWASNVAAISPGCVMIISSYCLALVFKRQSEVGNTEALPTPYQLGLLIEAFDGKLTSLWDGLCYLFWRRREKLNVLLRRAFGIFIVSLLLSALIWGADTWLHITVNTVPFSQVSPSKTPQSTFGYQYPPSCPWVYSYNYDGLDINAQIGSCNLTTLVADGYQIMSNSSNKHQVMTGVEQGSSFSYLTPAQPPRNLDFRTSTVAVSSSCQPVSRACNLHVVRSGQNKDLVAYNCSSGFEGAVNVTGSHPDFHKYAPKGSPLRPGSIVYPNGHFSFKPSPRPDIGTWPPSQRAETANKLHATSLMSVEDFLVGSNDILLTDPSVLYDDAKFLTILQCNVTMWNLTYSWVNGTLLAPTLLPADKNVTDFYLQWMYDGDAVAAQLSSLATSTMVQSLNSAQIATTYAASLEKLILAFTAALFSREPLTNSEEQTRRNLLVSRVPKAPLYTLIALCLLFVILGVTLLIMALTGRTAETREIQVRMSTFGMVASRFERAADARVENAEDLFEEHCQTHDDRPPVAKVSLVRQGDGWVFASSKDEVKKEKARTQHSKGLDAEP